MPIETPQGNLDIKNATLRTSNLETQNIKIGSIFVGTGNSLEETANVGNSMSNTIQFTNTHTAFTTTGNVEVGGELTVSGNVAVDTDTLFVDSVNNRVGVGTTSPSAKLQVGGNAETSPQHLWIRGHRVNEAGDIAGIHFYNSLISGDRGNSRIISSRGTNNYGSNLAFWTNPDTDDPALERMRILANGNVGIGTMDPSRNLHVFHPTYGVHRSIYWTEKPGDPATQNPIQMGYLGSSDPSHASGGLGLFKNTYEGGAEDEAVRIQANGNSWFKGGNVGIGTTSPTTALEISRTFTANDDTSAMISFTNSETNYYDWQIGPMIYSGSAGFGIKGGADGFGNLSDLITIRGTDVGIGTTNPTAKLHVNGTISYNTKQATHQTNTGLFYTTANAGQNIKSVTISTSGIAHVHVTGLWKLDTFTGTNGTSTHAIYFNLKKNSTEITASAVGHRMAKLGNSNDTDQWRPIVLSWSGAVSSGDQIHVYTSGVENSFSFNELDLNVLVV